MSSQANDSDVWYLGPFSLEQGAGFVVQGNLTTVLSTTISAIAQAKSRSANHALQVTFASTVGVTAGMLVTNTSRANSRAWTYKLISGNTWAMTQPGGILSGAVSPPVLKNCFNPAENDTWAGTDAVTISSVPVANISAASAVIQGQSSSSFANGFVLYNVGIRAQTATDSFAPSVIGSGTQLIESFSANPIYVTMLPSVGTGNLPNGAINSALAGGIIPSLGGVQNNYASSGTGFNAPQTCFSAGYAGTGTTYWIAPNNAQLNEDIILAAGLSSFSALTYGAIGFAYLDGGTLLTQGSLYVNAGELSAGAPVVYGTGVLDATGGARVFYPSGAGGAVVSFPLSGGLLINDQTKSCLGVPSVAAPTLTCNITTSATTLDANLGATLGCLWVEGGGSFCNYAR
jgi:hypothetical protein